MKHLILGLALALGLVLTTPVAPVAADSDSADSGSSGWKRPGRRGVPELDPTVTGSAMVLLLGGVAYLVARRRKDD